MLVTMVVHALTLSEDTPVYVSMAGLGKTAGENIDDCATAVCFNGATCHDRVASFFCECPVGKLVRLSSTSLLICRFCPLCSESHSAVPAGLLCHLDDACVSNPCNEGAVCDTNPLNGRAICTCPAGFVGGACNQDMDECSIGKYTEFWMPPSLTDSFCLFLFLSLSVESINWLLFLFCVPGANPCEHFGKCVNTEGSFQCQCGRGYTGPRCEIDINECLSMPCQNDATCLDRIGEFTCICMPGMSVNLILTYSETLNLLLINVVFQTVWLCRPT